MKLRKVLRMKFFIRGKEITDWKEVDFEEDDYDIDLMMSFASYKIYQGYDVKVEQKCKF